MAQVTSMMEMDGNATFDKSPHPIVIPTTPQKASQQSQPITPSTCAATPTVVNASLVARVAALKEAAEAAPLPSFENAFPAGLPAAVMAGPQSDGPLFEEILVKYGAGGVSAKRDAQHLESIVLAGMDANAVPFPKMPLRGKNPVCMLPASKDGDSATCHNIDPFPFLQEVAQKWSNDAEKEAVMSLLAGRAQGPDDLRTTFYSEEPLDMELVPWPTLQDGVMADDVCTEAQLLVYQRRAKKALSPERLERRLTALSMKFKGELNRCIFEEVRPQLEQEAAYLKLKADHARDKAAEACTHDELAEKGAAFVAWVLPNERRWPEQSSSWKRHAKWFKMWRARPIVASPFAFKPMQRSNSTSSLNSWVAVSDTSWEDIESKASECGWQEILDEQVPDLNNADPVKCLCKSDIIEIRSLKAPPGQVRLTMEVICVMLQVKPVQLKSGGVDYWEPAMALMRDAGFLDQVSALRDYMPASVLDAVAPYMAREDFTPEVVKKASCACEGLCVWARAVYRYHFLGHASAAAIRGHTACKSAAELLAESESAIKTLDKRDISELKAFGKPPREVADLCCCFVHLLAGIVPDVELTKKGNVKSASWKSFKKLAGNPCFLKYLCEFKDAIDSGRVPRRNIQKARKAQVNMGKACSHGVMCTKSKAAAGLVKWLLAILDYYDLTQPQQPSTPVLQEVVQPEPQGPISKGDITELKSLASPPAGVVEVVTAACVLLGAEQPIDWKCFLGDVTFLNKLVTFDIEKVSPSTIEQAKAIAEKPDFSVEKVASKSKAAAGLAKWVLRTLGLPESKSN